MENHNNINSVSYQIRPINDINIENDVKTINLNDLSERMFKMLDKRKQSDTSDNQVSINAISEYNNSDSDNENICENWKKFQSAKNKEILIDEKSNPHRVFCYHKPAFSSNYIDSNLNVNEYPRENTLNSCWLTTRRIAMIIVASAIVLTLLMVTYSGKLINILNKKSVSNTPDNSISLSKNNTPSLKTILRNEWKAESARRKIAKLNPPVSFIIIAHTGNSSCNTEEECIRLVALEQKNDFRSELPDIRYNFLVGGDGAIYFGRGWDTENEQYNSYYSKHGISIAFIGNFNINLPPPKQLEATKMFIEHEINFENITTNYRIHGECQLITKSDSPGSALFRIIQKWDNFSEILE